ncbi:MAG: PIN/TRAM domain-containing protein [Anaerolineae bacterium]
MTRRYTFWTRIVGALAFAIAGYGAGRMLWPDPDVNQLAVDLGSSVEHITVTRLMVSVSFALFGLAFGYVISPFVFQPLQSIARELQQTPPKQIVGASVGLAFGLLLSALVAIPLSQLPDPFSQFLPFFVAITLAYLGAAVGSHDPDTYLGPARSIIGSGDDQDGGKEGGDYIVLDTSVIIDGRITDVAETGFLVRTLLVPRFVLGELQQIADSADALRRNRGRRGLEVLNQLQQSQVVKVEIADREPPGGDVDRKLVMLAEELDCPIMTNDFNLNRVAEIQGVTVLNLNELANAVKTVLLPGETIDIAIIQEGKEFGQGVGYLEDGTMVVVEGGRDYIGQTIEVVVTRMLQTVAGRMVFGTPSLGDADDGLNRGHSQ